MKPNWFLSVGFFGVGVVVGAVFLGEGGQPVSISPAPEHANPSVAVPERPLEVPQPSHREEPQTENAPQVGFRLRALAELNGCLRSRIRVPLIGFDRLNNDFVAVYDVTAGEKAQLEAAIADAKNQIAQLETKLAVITPGAEGVFSISIPSFPAEGGAVFDELHRTVRSVLGEERYTAYQLYGYDAESHALGGFGVSETAITIRKPGTPNDWSGSWSSSAGADGVLTKTVDMGRLAFAKQYPELARKMVAEGFWQMPVEP